MSGKEKRFNGLFNKGSTNYADYTAKEIDEYIRNIKDNPANSSDKFLVDYETAKDEYDASTQLIKDVNKISDEIAKTKTEASILNKDLSDVTKQLDELNKVEKDYSNIDAQLKELNELSKEVVEIHKQVMSAENRRIIHDMEAEYTKEIGQYNDKLKNPNGSSSIVAQPNQEPNSHVGNKLKIHANEENLYNFTVDKISPNSRDKVEEMKDDFDVYYGSNGTVRSLD